MQLQDLVRDYGRTLVESLVGCCFLAATWAASRTKRWLLELVEREKLACEKLIAEQQRRSVEQHNETLRTLAEASANGDQPTLASLLANAERDWSLESSPTPFEPPRPSVPPQALPSAPYSSGRAPTPPEPSGWSDDDLPTMTPGTIPPKWSPPNNGK